MFKTIEGGIDTAISKLETTEARRQTGNEIIGGVHDAAHFMVKTGNEVTMSLYEESTKMKEKIKESGVVEVVGDSVSQGI